jgi:hypothetical protein
VKSPSGGGDVAEPGACGWVEERRRGVDGGQNGFVWRGRWVAGRAGRCDSWRGELGSFGAGEASGAGLAFGGAGAGGALGVLAIGLGLFVGGHKVSSRLKKSTRRLG